MLLELIEAENLSDWTRATQEAGRLGARAVAPLADKMKLDSRTKGRAAKLSLQAVVNYSARPGADVERKAVAVELLKIANQTYPRMIRSDVLYWLGLIGGPEQVPGISRLLQIGLIREDARIALERIPGDESLKALQAAVQTALADFRRNLQQSLHNRALTRDSAGIKEGVRTVG